MSVSAVQVKELRERTNVGMMECKKALEEAGGDMQLAVDILRKKGKAKADKRAEKVASEGVVLIKASNDGKQAVMVEVNSETDFVGRDENFLNFGNAIAAIALEKKVRNISDLNALALKDYGNITIEEARQALVAKVGENIHIRRLVFVDAANTIGIYLHGNRIGVLVELDSVNPEVAKDVAMHIAACKPLVVGPGDVPQDLVAKEKEIYLAQAMGSGKPQDIIEKMASGRLKKFLDEISLLGQPFVKDPNMTVEALLNKQRVKVLAFTRFEVGEGIEKEKEDFVEAVMSQVQGS
jgi:elongation factor Ts